MYDLEVVLYGKTFLLSCNKYYRVYTRDPEDIFEEGITEVGRQTQKIARAKTKQKVPKPSDEKPLALALDKRITLRIILRITLNGTFPYCAESDFQNRVSNRPA